MTIRYRQTIYWRFRPQEPGKDGRYLVRNRDGGYEMADFAKPRSWSIPDVVAWSPIPIWDPPQGAAAPP